MKLTIQFLCGACLLSLVMGCAKDRAVPNPTRTNELSDTDFDVFGNNLLEVMQFVFNRTTFNPKNNLDQAVLAAYAPLGVKPGKAWDPASAAQIDGSRFRKIAEGIAAAELAKLSDPESKKDITRLFQPKEHMTLELLL